MEGHIKLVSKASYVLIPLLILSILILLYSDSFFSSQVDVTDAVPESVDEVVLLSTEEVEAERQLLPESRLSDSEETVRDQDDGSLTAQSVADDITPPELEVEVSPVQGTEDLVARQIEDNDIPADTTDDSTVSPRTVYVAPDSDVQVVGASATNVQEEMQMSDLTGMVFRVDLDGQYLQLDSEEWDGLVWVRTTPSTVVTINQQPMSINDLQITDVIRVQGAGTRESAEITADSIEVIGATAIDF